MSAPTNKLPTDLRAQIAERKADIFTLLLQRSLTKRAAAPPIKPRARSEPAPLSFAQERLWFLEQLEPEISVYNICRASRLLGNLNASALEASLSEIISRHETLRTAFRLVEGRPVQVVQQIRNISIEYVDFRAMPDDERDVEIQRRIKAESDCPFDLSAGLLLRSTLLRAGDDEHVLILMTHHSASDAWSMGILTRELWTLYEAFSNGNPSPFEPLQVQYSDYAVWQRNWFQGEVLDAQLDYWKKQLENLSIVKLPTDRPRTPRQSFRGARVSITLPQALTASINELSNRIAVTPFMTLLAAFQVLLCRYTGQEDVVVGSPIANRRRPEIEGLIGFFVNTLVLRANLCGNPSFLELVSRIRDTCVAADAKQDLPFEKLVQEIQPERDLSRNPLFQVMFVLQNATSPFSGIPGLRIEPIERAATRSPFDLSLFLRERGKQYIGYIEYSTDLFNRDRIERMAGHFQTLLETIVTDPDRPIATLPILTDAERQQIFIDWNNTAADYPKDKCIHQLFEEQVERRPEAIALEFEDHEITYRDLNRRANQLAHYLIGLGIGPEKLVGICIERSIEMVVGLLGILKAGGAYVPLDPAYPKERLQFMVQDAQLSVVLATENLIADGRWRMYDGNPQSSILDPRVKIACLDRDAAVVEQQSTENSKGRAGSENLAYVIYTSGSTGQPKGVAIEHRNTCNLLHWAKSVYAPEGLKGVLASTSICFDLSVFELFVPLSWGGKAVLVEDALCLIKDLNARDVTLINTVPSVMTALLATGRFPATVETINLAGEPLSAELVKQILDHGMVKKVYDLYGPSETTTYSTFVLRMADGPATIGRPISNTQIYVLDSHLEPVPIGVPGELYIGGEGVSRGYLNRPELTSETFISNPFSEDHGSRLYRTADLAKYLPDGNIEFLGRADNQVKIRGYRIEIGEIEAVLNEHPAVKETVVLACDADVGDLDDADNRKSKVESPKSLVGYVVSTRQSTSLIAELRDYLTEKLPDYMIPSAFVILDALPLTPSGKVNRNALRAAEIARPDLGREFAEPRTEIEELLAQTWREVLKIENIGIHDNFFEVGGHSLLAIQIVSRAREALDKDVPLSALFDRPTIAGLATTIGNTVSGRFHDLPPIVRVPRGGPLPLSMNQEHLWRLDRMIPGTHFFNMPYVYRLSGDLKVSALEKALRELIRRHEAFRTVFAETDGHPTQIIKEVPELELPHIDLSGEFADDISEKAADFILEERQRPFDLALGPLLRIKLLRLTNTEYLFLVTMHHITSDYWSMQIFRRELAALYEAFARGRPSPLPEPSTQFVDFAIWERQLLRMSLLDSQLSYWKRQLIGRLPDSYGVSNQAKPAICHVSHATVEVDRILYAAIRHLAERERCTPFVVLVCAFSIALCDYTGNQDVIIATLAANRSKPESECVVGHLMNTLILRFQVSLRNTIRQLLRQVRAQMIEAFAHQHFPFEELARVLESDAGVTRQSMCRVLFSYQHRYPEVRQCSGLTFAPFHLQFSKPAESIGLSTFDLILGFTATSTELTGAVNYRTESLSGARARRIVQVFSKMLRLMVSDPSQNVSAALMQV